MKESIGYRRVLTVDMNGVGLRGTYHIPDGDIPSGTPGILIVNAGFLPRAATGDMAVHLGDALARRGHPCFRFDLPGLGDSGGDIPTDLVEWANSVNQGCYVSAVERLEQYITEQFGNDGIVIVGHCAGAVSAIFAAATSTRVRGLILLDPYFQFFRADTAIREGLQRWVRRNRIGGVLSRIYHQAGRAAAVFRGKGLPKDANASLIRCWNDIADSGIPVLTLLSKRNEITTSQDNYFSQPELLARGSGNVAVVEIDGTDHSFANQRGREAVEEHTTRWLGNNFSTSRSQGNREQLGVAKAPQCAVE